MNKKRKCWFARLFDMDDSSVSASTVFLFLTTLIALILLLVPAISLLVEIYYNHTISSDISGFAEYIAAVCGIFASGGILKGWTNYTNYRFNNQKKSKQEISNVINDMMQEYQDEEKDEEKDEELDA